MMPEECPTSSAAGVPGFDQVFAGGWVVGARSTILREAIKVYVRDVRLKEIFMTTIHATAARRDFELVKGAAEAHKTFRIQHRRGTAVLMSGKTMKGFWKHLNCFQSPGFRQSIKRSLKQAAKVGRRQ
jgi:hypothetical protein